VPNEDARVAGWAQPGDFSQVRTSPKPDSSSTPFDVEPFDENRRLKKEQFEQVVDMNSSNSVTVRNKRLVW
jgi:hypothetical protein